MNQTAKEQLQLFLDCLANSEDVKKYSMWNLIAHFVGAFITWAYCNMPGLEAYAAFGVLSLLVCEAVVLYGCYQGADKPTIVAIMGIHLSGVIVQSVFQAESAGIRTAEWGMIIFGSIATLLCMLVLHKVRVGKGKPEVLCIGSIVATVGFLGLACLFGRGAGTGNWQQIFGMSVQITEFVKLFAILSLGLLYLTEWNEWLKFALATVFVGACAAALAYINEMGFLMVICAVYFVIVCMYSGNWIRVTAVIAAIAVLAFLYHEYSYVDKLAYQWECYNGCLHEVKVGNKTIETKYIKDASVCDNCQTGKLRYRPSFVCERCYFRKFTPITEDQLVEKVINGEKKLVYPCDICYYDSKLQDDTFGKLRIKLFQRFSVFFNYNQIKYEDSARQVRQGQEEAILSGWFGNRVKSPNIINMKNDSVVVGICGYMGFIAVMVVLLLYYMFFLSIRKARSPVKAALILSMSVQALLTTAGNFNLFALTGVGIPLISSGGTGYLISLITVFLILTRDNRFPNGGETC